jgi:hypothetical protein
LIREHPRMLDDVRSWTFLNGRDGAYYKNLDRAIKMMLNDVYRIKPHRHMPDVTNRKGYYGEHPSQDRDG